MAGEWQRGEHAQPLSQDLDDRMDGTVIVCESGSDIQPVQAEELGVYLAPMQVAFDGKDHLDGHFPTSEILDYYRRTKKIAQSGAATPGTYREVFQRIRSDYPNKRILHLCYSAVTTATWNNALIASEGIEGIIHIDTEHVCSAQGAIVRAMVRWLFEHPHAKSPEIIEAAYAPPRRTWFSFVPGDLAYLKAGGRLSNAAYLGASLLRIKPVVDVVDGRLVASEKKRGAMLPVCADLARRRLLTNPTVPESLFFVYSDGFNDLMKKGVEKAVGEAGYEPGPWRATGGVIYCHSGPASFGVGGIRTR